MDPLAEQGDAGAQYNLGLMYRNGQGVPQDYKTAVKWYTLAAEQGIALAQNVLGEIYFKGQRGIPQNYSAAFAWHKRAADNGVVDSWAHLGYIYLKGLGAIQDYVTAHMWFNIAASSGFSPTSVKNREIVEKKMTSAQIAEAQKLARECVRKKYKGC